MKNNSNPQIVVRLFELSKNKLAYNYYPKPFKKEYIWLSNILNDGLRQVEREFSDAFRKAIGEYKQTLEKEGKGFGWFHNAENLIWIRTQYNQLKYAIYGDVWEDLVFRAELGNEAYKDLIMQIDRTVLMSPEELKHHEEEWASVPREILDELLKEEQNSKNKC